MPTYDVSFYDFDPFGSIPYQSTGSFVWTGAANFDASGTITDNEAGIQGETLDDDSNGGETATATVTTGAGTSTGVNVDAEIVWTIQDNVTGETFQIAEFQVEGGGANGYYLLSEQILIPGRSYTIQEYNSNPDASAGDIALTYGDIQDGVIDGTAAGELIDNTYSDAQQENVDGEFDLDDRVEAGGGNDTIVGGAGDDTLLGEAGDDLIYGDFGAGTVENVAAGFSWGSQGGNGTDVSSGFTQDAGPIDVVFSSTDDGNNTPVFEVDTNDDVYVAPGETFDANASLYMFGDGDGATATTTIDFSASSGSNVEDEVVNVAFRINDIDYGAGNHTDIVTINAYDAEGNPVAVTITPAGRDTVSGNTITASEHANSPGDADGSALIEIAGPVATIDVIYSNGQTGTQAIWLSEVQFDAVPNTDNNDSLEGGAGNDTLIGEGGDDTLDGGADDDSLQGGDGADSLLGGGGSDTLEGGAGADIMDAGSGDDSLLIGQGDTVTGGDGDDVFTLVDLAEAGSGTITIDGGTGTQSSGDSLDLAGLADRTTMNITSMTGTEQTGTIQMLDGTVVSFTNIDGIICFTPGTRILTENGYRPIETLKIGDKLITRDAGAQPLRWIGQRTVLGTGASAPISIAAHVLPGGTRPLLVSPQHRMLFEGYHAELLFGQNEVFAAASHLVNNADVLRVEQPQVTYIHLMLDAHHVIYAEGMATESFYLGGEGIKTLDPREREALFDIFPEYRADPSLYGETARMCLKKFEARALQEQMDPVFAIAA